MKQVKIGKWEFKQESELNDVARSYLPARSGTTVSWLDLLEHELIPDPFIDTNELATQWVNEADWTYRSTFPSPGKSAGRCVLVFDGLQTVCDVYLNDKHVLFSDNVHLQHRIDVTDMLKSKGNVLELKFRAALPYAFKERERMGWKKSPSDDRMMGTHARLYLRMPQYAAGWDWGPCCIGAGPWKPVYLECYDTRIADVHVRCEVQEDLKKAVILVDAEFEGSRQQSATAVITLTHPDGRTQSIMDVQVKDVVAQSTINIDQPELWYPHTHGKQPLYQIEVKLDSHTVHKHIGLKRLELLQRPLKHHEGTSFTFVVNNMPIFIGGADWIPDDFFNPRTTPERLRSLLGMMRQGHQNMVRVWGGGFYESTEFYEICDELGLMVWQDCCFACGNYPDHPDFIANVQKEIEQNIRRIRHHASLAIIAGNNEDYQIAEGEDWGYDIDDDDPEHWTKTAFPARKIYEIVLPDMMSRLVPYVPYWRSSPYGGSSTRDSTVGDVHIWDVWHGPMHPYQMYKDFTARFVSEFGFESPPDMRTIKAMLTRPEDRQSQSLAFDAHDKGPGNRRRFTMYMGENFRFRMDPLEDYVYCARLLQADAIGFAYNAWRREFRGPGEEVCSGVLVWQLNDSWPGTSWAMIDYTLRPKPLYYVVKRALQPVTVGMERTVTQAQPLTIRSYPDETCKMAVWATSNLPSALKVRVEFAAWDVTTGRKVDLSQRHLKATLQPNRSTELCEFSMEAPANSVVAAYLYDSQGEKLARWISWPDPVKFVKFAKDPGLRVNVEHDHVELFARAPIKGLVLDVATEEQPVWEDNCLDLVPGETIVVKAKGLDGKKVVTRWLCDWECTA